MGPTQQRNRGASTHRGKRVYRTRHRHGQHLRKHTYLQRTQTTPNTESEQQLDSTDRRHFGSLPTRSSSNRRSPHVSTNRVLQQSRRNRLEAQQSNLRFEKFTKSMANTLSRRTTAAWSTAVNSRTQHLLHAAAQRLHLGLRGWPTSSWRRADSQQDLWSNPATPLTSTNRNLDGRKHSVLPRTQHHQQRRLLWTWTGRQLQQHTSRRSKDGELQTSNSTRNISIEDTNSRPWPTTEWRRTQSIPTSSRQTTMDDIHKTRHLLRNKRTSTSIAAANIVRPAEAQTSSTIHQRNNTLQTDHTTNGQADADITRPQRLRWQRLGRMCRNTEVNNRFQYHIPKSNNFLRKQNTSNNRLVERRSRIVCHQHRSNGSITLSESTHRFTEHQQSKHQNTHRLIERQKHCNKDRNRKENKARWIETSIYTTIGSTKSFAHHQNTHQRQSGRYLYKVRFSRHTATSPTQCWTAHPTLSTLKLLAKQHAMFHKLL